MALGWESEIVDTFTEKDDAYGTDPEKDDPVRKMSRVGGPLATLGDSDEDSTISVGKQIELEQSSAIKYRTCSWQKVCPTPNATSHMRIRPTKYMTQIVCSLV